jgi:hypothetical protein
MVMIQMDSPTGVSYAMENLRDRELFGIPLKLVYAVLPALVAV